MKKEKQYICPNCGVKKDDFRGVCPECGYIDKSAKVGNLKKEEDK
jgi:rubredoxin